MKCNYLLTLLGILGILFSSVKVSDAQMTVAKIDQQPVEKQAENGIRFFEGSWEQALAEAKSTGKPIFMDCYTSWCVPCKMLATTVFTKKEVGDYFNSHFINVKMDMESKEGKTLNKQYEILGYPTLLFIDGGGNMFHRIVGTTPAEILLKEAARALDGNGYSVMKKKYGEGNRQPDFIQEYMEVLSVAGEDKVAARVCVDYFNTLEKSRLKEPEYWKLFQKYVKDVDAGISKYMYKNREEFITLFGEKEVNRKLYQLYSEGAYRYWKDDVFDTKGFDRYTSQLMKTDLKQREQIIDEARMYYAMKTNNWQEYIRLGNERIKKGLNDDFMIYNWGLKVNVLCKDMVLREEAAKWLDVIAANCDKKPNDKYMAALKNYHHVVYQMTHDYDSEMTRQFKADTWHNMGMVFLRLHNIKCAAECMKRAFELVKTQDFLAPYMYVLELLGDHEKILTLIRQEDIPTDISDAVLNRYKEAEHLCEHSEENRKIQDGLTLGNGQTTAKYWDFVRDYLNRQKKNYDLT